MFDVFLKEFNKEFSDVEDFITLGTWCGSELKLTIDNSSFNSYGELDESDIYQVHYFPEWDVYVRFEGKKSSYGSEYWGPSFHQVKPEIITVVNYKKA